MFHEATGITNLTTNVAVKEMVVFVVAVVFFFVFFWGGGGGVGGRRESCLTPLVYTGNTLASFQFG